jgi:hypothetical protein
MKKRVRRCDPQKQRHWEEVVRRWSKAGQSVRAFCRNAGVRESAFYFWRRELLRRGRRADVDGGLSLRACVDRVDTESGTLSQRRPLPPATRLSPRVPARSDATPLFLPVHVVTPGVAEAACGVEIILAGGRTVRVPARFDRQTLADVLALLEALPC